MSACGTKLGHLGRTRESDGEERAFKDGSVQHPPPVIHTRLQIRLNPRFRVGTRARTQVHRRNSAPPASVGVSGTDCSGPCQRRRCYTRGQHLNVNIFKSTQAADASSRRGCAHRAFGTGRVAHKNGADHHRWGSSGRGMLESRLQMIANMHSRADRLLI